MIIPFKEISNGDMDLVGGKGINLGRMIQAGFPIPQGFCITTDGYSSFIEESGFCDELFILLDKIQIEDTVEVKHITKRVRELLLSVDFPYKLREDIRAEWSRMDPHTRYAVRSSATAEDLPEASFAGQQSTFLNIIGFEPLLKAIKECWISLFSDRSILYRIKNNFNHRDVKLAVVIQEMVESEISGVMFTADPLTSNRNCISIDASYGLGEALVSGLVNPDHFNIDKSELVIRDRNIGDKTLLIEYAVDGGTVERVVSDDRRGESSLSDKQIIRLSKIGLEIEEYYGVPQDIEWAVVKDNIYILQARPITSLFPIDHFSSLNGYHIFFSMGHQQNMTNVMTPLSMSSMQNIIPFGRTVEYDNRLLIDSGGHLFIDLTKVLRHPIFGKRALENLAMLDSRLPELLGELTKRDEFKKERPMRLTPKMFLFSTIAFFRIVNALFFKNNYHLYHIVNKNILSYTSKFAKNLEEHKSRDRIPVMLTSLQNAYKLLIKWAPALAAGMIANRVLNKLSLSILDSREIDALSLGLPGNIVTEMNLELGDLADSVRESSELIIMFDKLDMDYDLWLEEVKQCRGSREFMNRWENFLNRFGARGLSEIEIMNKRWYEDPLPLLRVIRTSLDRERGYHHIVVESLKKRREEATKKLLNHKKGLKRIITKRLIKVMEDGSILREHHKFAVIQLFRHIKESLKEITTELVDEKRLEYKEDIWFLRWNELLDIYHNNRTNYRELIRERREIFKRYKDITPPIVISSSGEIPSVDNKSSVEEGTLVGNPVSLGVYQGVVHIITDPETERLNPGEIMVSRFTDPGWTPLFINAGALIMEVGGVLTHGSVVAREYNIPAVVGVDSVTKLLKTGQRVEVDGNSGVIRVLGD